MYDINTKFVKKGKKMFSLFFIIKAIFGFFFLSKKDNKQY